MTAAGRPPLEGVLVVELTSLVPGPFAGAILAGYGARVIRVEPPAGDALRHMQPQMFELCNRGKASVVLDLKSEDGRRHLDAVLARADVLLTSYRRAAQRRLGIDADAVAARHPRLVHVSISGYADADDPRPGHDLNYLAEGGAVHLFGLGRTADAPILTIPIADLGGAQFAASAAVARLYERAVHGTASPAVVSLAAAAVALTRTRTAEVAARAPGTSIPDVVAKPAYGTFRSADGRWIAIAALEDHHWTALADVLALGDELRELGYGDRLRGVRRINEVVERAVSRLEAAALLEPATARAIAASPVADLDAAGLELAIPGGGTVGGSAPALGGDTDRILAEVGVAP